MKRRIFIQRLATIALASNSCMAIPVLAKTSKLIHPSPDDALIVIDMQNCFLPGGTLAVQNGDQTIAVINSLAKKFENAVLTQDWHTSDHVSFASQHPGKKPYETIKLPYGEQVLWPMHCVQGTADAEIAQGIDIPHAQMIVRKGYHSGIDSYSAFIEADHETQTGLAGYLKERRIKNVYLCGLATDFCVAWSALDARKLGFNTFVIEDASRGIDLNGSLKKSWVAMENAGVNRIQSTDIVR
jgi:nicotinamidase/pyrazinamidase